VVIGYGLTEAGTVITVNDLKPFRANTVGKPLNITQVKIHNADAHGVGEVWAKGSTVMKGYLNADDLTAENIEDGWLKTGDLGKMDRGHLILLGRKKNMIVTAGGKNVYPEDIETTFDRIHGIEEYCILAKRLIWPSTDLTHDSMVLIVKPKEDARAPEVMNEIRNRNRSLSDYKRVSEILMWNAPFSRTASMKIKRNELADEITSNIKPSDPRLVSL
jgi:long-chain acyl-CoA synthetase